LPLAGVQKFVLEFCAGILRLALLGVLAAAAYLWFQPGDLPAVVTAGLDDLPRLRDILPEPGSQYFGICTAALVVILFLPLLALLDVSRKLAGWRLRRLRTLVAEPTVVRSPSEPAMPQAVRVRRVDRRSAANALAEVGSARPVQTAG
jgi:hypothetical protein